MFKEFVMAYTIKEVEEKTGISSHTLRFWAKSNLFPFIERDDNNVRYFSEQDLGWVAVVHCLRQSGLSVGQIKEYVDLCLKGDSTFEARLAIIQKQRDETQKIIYEYKQALDKLESKVQYYEDAIYKRDKEKIERLNPNKLKGYFENPQNKRYKGVGENAAKTLAK